MLNPITEKIIKELKKSKLSLEDRTALTTVLLDKLQALPLSSTFIIDQNGVTINGKNLEPEQAISFTESCAALKDNYARKVFNEQIKYLAINMGVHKSMSLEEVYFAKSALWCLAQMDELIDKVV